MTSNNVIIRAIYAMSRGDDLGWIDDFYIESGPVLKIRDGTNNKITLTEDNIGIFEQVAREASIAKDPYIGKRLKGALK